MRTFTREKKIYCGDNHLEVDIYTYTKTQEEASRRGKRSKKRKESEPKQKNLNDKNAKRYFIQKVNTNFGEGDLHITSTYKDKFLPATPEEAEKIARNFLRRVDYRMKKEGLGPLKYILVTEYVEGTDKNEKVRIHHHIFMNGGLDRDVIEELWSKRKRKGEKKGERLGIINADRLQPNENGAEALCRYLTKYKNRKKRWSSSQNLKKPYSRTNDHKYSKREVERICKEMPDRAYWEKKYPGWTLTNDYYGFRPEYNDITGWSIYLKLRKLE